MSIYYSASTRGFYVEGIHTDLPTDSISISQEYYELLLSSQSEGKEIEPNDEGYPEVVESKPSTLTWDKIRAKRDQLIKDTDWTQLADIPESTKTKWSSYRQQLRDIPQVFSAPESVIWPDPV